MAAVERAMPVTPSTRIEYRLMRLARASWAGPAAHASAAAAAEGVRVRRSGIGDAALLFPLQRAYELEEVVIDPALFSDAACLKLLRQGLRQELVFHASRDGRPLAKAGTNARGFGVDQIGGVFTLASERGKGLARIVMAALLEEIFAEKPAACLFVKTANAPAIALYERLGFTTLRGYVISYYGIREPHAEARDQQGARRVRQGRGVPPLHPGGRRRARYLESFLGGRAMAPEARVLTNEKGFCPEHTLRLYRGHNPLGLAVMTHTHLQHQAPALRAALTAARRPGRAAAARPPRRPHRGAPRPLPDLRHARGGPRPLGLHHRLPVEARLRVSPRMAGSRGFCLDHLRAVILSAGGQLGPADLERFLADVLPLAEAGLERLQTDVHDFSQLFQHSTPGQAPRSSALPSRGRCSFSRDG